MNHPTTREELRVEIASRLGWNNIRQVPCSLGVIGADLGHVKGSEKVWIGEKNGAKDEIPSLTIETAWPLYLQPEYGHIEHGAVYTCVSWRDSRMMERKWVESSDSVMPIFLAWLESETGTRIELTEAQA